jgi:hypothetical protein
MKRYLLAYAGSAAKQIKEYVTFVPELPPEEPEAEHHCFTSDYCLFAASFNSERVWRGKFGKKPKLNFSPYKY